MLIVGGNCIGGRVNLVEGESLWWRNVSGGRGRLEEGESGGGVHVGICRGRLEYEGVLVEGVVWP